MDKHSDNSKIKENATPNTVDLDISEILKWTKSPRHIKYYYKEECSLSLKNTTKYKIFQNIKILKFFSFYLFKILEKTSSDVLINIARNFS